MLHQPDISTVEKARLGYGKETTNVTAMAPGPPGVHMPRVPFPKENGCSSHLATEFHLAFDLHVESLQDLEQRIPRHVLIILALVARNLPGVHMH